LRNLRNFEQEGVPSALIQEAVAGIDPARVLPFRFIAAARHAPRFEPELEKKLMECLKRKRRLKGHTVILVDVSGSMDYPLSSKSEVRRVDAACGLAMILRELCEEVDVLSFSNHIKAVPPRHGFALRDAIVGSQSHGGTYLGAAVAQARQLSPNRIICVTDEQSHDSVPDPNPSAKGYVVNVASNQNGVGYGAWTHIDGFSEAIVDYILESEKQAQ